MRSPDAKRRSDGGRGSRMGTRRGSVRRPASGTPRRRAGGPHGAGARHRRGGGAGPRAAAPAAAPALAVPARCRSLPGDHVAIRRAACDGSTPTALPGSPSVPPAPPVGHLAHVAVLPRGTGPSRSAGPGRYGGPGAVHGPPRGESRGRPHPSRPHRALRTTEARRSRADPSSWPCRRAPSGTVGRGTRRLKSCIVVDGGGAMGRLRFLRGYAGTGSEAGCRRGGRLRGGPP